MSTFRIGQRVRVVMASSRHFGAEATVTGGPEVTKSTRTNITAPRYFVTLTNGTSIGAYGNPLAYEAHELEPLIPNGAAPSELTFTELMDRCKAGEVECV